MAEQKARRKKSNEFPEDALATIDLDGLGYLSVGELTQYLSEKIQQDPLLSGPVMVRGEMSNIKRSSRGHVYFTLKDSQAAISGIIWASLSRSLAFELEEGMDVFATGVLEIYRPSGTYSLVLKKLEPVGMGTLQLAFLQLKEKLTAEGLFREEYKQDIPDNPTKIGIITSSTGAVIHDMLRVLRRKNPLVSVLLHPVAVQGESAAIEIARAVEELNRPEYGLDVLIVARGGGSLEDLFCFSQEPVVRAIFASKLPIITGIGHEPDFSLADAAADLSVSTPTAAAETVVPDFLEQVAYYNAQEAALIHGMEQVFYQWERWLDERADRLIQIQGHTLERASVKLSYQQEKLLSGIEGFLHQCSKDIALYAESLDAYNPLAVLKRGYTRVGLVKIDSTKPQWVTHRSDVAVGDRLQVEFSDGPIQVEVLSHGT